MTFTSFDDPIAFERRWGRLSAAARQERAQAQPLLFIADHVSIFDRRNGALAIQAELIGRPPTLIVISDAAPSVDAEACLNTLLAIVERLLFEAGVDPEDAGPGSMPIQRLGLVHHRIGRAHITELDRHWAQAMSDTCDWLGIEAIGVMARTSSGAVVEVPLPLPRDLESVTAL